MMITGIRNCSIGSQEECGRRICYRFAYVLPLLLLFALVWGWPQVASAQESTGGRSPGDMPMSSQGAPVAGNLTPFVELQLEGNYTAKGIGLIGQTSGTIVINTIPVNSTVVGAYLYWSYAAPSPIGLEQLTFNGQAIVGTFIGSTNQSCIGEFGNTYAYRSDVTSLVSGNGSYTLTNVASSDTIFAHGAGLIIIYEDSQERMREILILDGMDLLAEDSPVNITNSFEDFTTGAPTDAQTTFMTSGSQPDQDEYVAVAGGSGGQQTYPNSLDASDGLYWDMDTIHFLTVVPPWETSFSATIGPSGPPEVSDCIVWLGQVFSVNAGTDFQLEKTVDSAAVNVFEQVTFTVTATNNGPNDATNVEVFDQPPGGLIVDAVTPSQGSYDPGTDTWNIPSLPAGSSETLTILATVGATGPITNTAFYLLNELVDPDTSNNSASATVEGQAADLALTKVGTEALDLGDPITYTITLANNGPNGATEIEVLDQQPEGLVFNTVTPSQGNYDPNSGIWTVGSLANGASATLTIAATVQDLCATNSTTITASSRPDLALSNNTAVAGTGTPAWTNSNGGNWNNVANWSPTMPGPGDNACITLDGTYTVNLDASATVNSLILGTNSGTNTQTLSIGGSRVLTLNANSTVGPNGAINWTGGTIATGAGVALTNAGTITMSSNSNKILNNGAMLVNQGTVSWSEGPFNLYNGSTFVNEGLFDMQGDDNIDGGFTAPNTFINGSAGSFRKSGGTGNSILISDTVFENHGLVEAQSGSIVFQGQSSHTDAILAASAGATVRFDAGTHTIIGTLGGTPDGSVIMDGGATLNAATGGATLDFGGTGFDWQGGTISGSEPLINAGLVKMSSNSNKVLDGAGVLINADTVSWNGGPFNLYNGSTFVNEGLFDMQGDDNIDGGFATPNTFVNAATGILRKSAGTGNSTLIGDITLENHGLVEAQSGSILIQGPSSHIDAELTATTISATVRLDSNTHTITGTLSGAPVGSVIMDSGATLQAGTGGTLDFGGTGFEWQAGIIAGGTPLANSGLLKLTRASNKVLNNGTTLVNQGTVSWSDGPFNIFNGSTFVNEGLFEMLSNDNVDGSSAGTNTFVNANSGILRKSAGDGTSTVIGDIAFENQAGAVIDAANGTLDFNGPMNHSMGALIQGTATIDVISAAMSNNGMTGPGASAGILSWLGAYSPSASAELHVELGGLTPGSEHDQLAISGNATLAGTISASLIDGFTPADGDSFTVLTATSISGAFSNDSIDLGGGVVLQVVINPTNVTLVAQVEPLPTVSIELTPLGEPIVIPPGGGSYQYEVSITNNTDSAQSFAAAFLIEGPGGISRVIGPFSLNFAPGQSASQVLTQQVPGGAPAGGYTHTGFVGTSPSNIYDSDSFTWEKAAAGGPEGRAVTSWGSDLARWLEALAEE